MRNRLDKTLVDYVVIAISPALIISLIGSLVLFLVEVFYQGSYGGRLQYVFALYVAGAVLVGRISIEQGREHAALFTIPLIIVTLLGINRFAEFQGALASYSFFINCGLTALVWWAADKLTWDCTLIDEEQEDTGEGLLEAVGLEGSDKAAMQEEIATAAVKEPEGVTSRNVRQPTWWERFVERRRRPHAPGVWVVYFSLAAIPLFGIGQIFSPTGSLSNRLYVFHLLLIYTASGLGLLLTTSFLGLRRYLRQRRLEMPPAMAGAWLGAGAVLIVGVMAAAMCIPRPNAEYAVSQLPIRMSSHDRKSSAHAMGGDAVSEKKPWARGEQRDKKEKDSVRSEQAGNSPSAGPKNTSPDGKTSGKQEGKDEKPPDETRSEAGKEPPSKAGEPKGKEKSQDGPSGQETKSKSDQKTAERGENQSGGKDQKETGQAKEKDTTGPSQSHDAEQQEATQKQEGSRSTNTATPPSTPHRSFSLPHMPPMMDLFKWILYGALAFAAGYGFWAHRQVLLAALKDFGRWWREFLDRLFGQRTGRSRTISEPSAIKPLPVRRFTNFRNPFSTGTPEEYAPEELVRYTFEALEAWGRDRGFPREPEQTPHEFARHLGANAPSVADDAKRLADLYCRVAYAKDPLSAMSVRHLPGLWQTMEAEATWSGK